MKGRIQHPKYTAAALAAANPVLLDGEIVYESDTGRCKMGDGTTAWVDLPYTFDAEAVPALLWKVEDQMLYVKAATDPNNPILKRCSVGILHYKNARLRNRVNSITGAVTSKPKSAGFKLVQDKFAYPDIPWTSVRIDPMPYLALDSGWMPLIRAQDLFDRWVETISDPNFSGGGEFLIHMGTRTGDLTLERRDPAGKILMRASFYTGVVLFTGSADRRIEGPRSLFKVTANNNIYSLSITHI